MNNAVSRHRRGNTPEMSECSLVATSLPSGIDGPCLCLYGTADIALRQVVMSVLALLLACLNNTVLQCFDRLLCADDSKSSSV